MRCSDVIELRETTRRYVVQNISWLKCGNWKIVVAKSFADE